MGTCQQDMGTWEQAEHSRKQEVVVQKVKGMEGSRVPSGKRKKFAVAGTQEREDTGAREEFKRYIWVEYNSILCCTKEFWTRCCT